MPLTSNETAKTQGSGLRGRLEIKAAELSQLLCISGIVCTPASPGNVVLGEGGRKSPQALDTISLSKLFACLSGTGEGVVLTVVPS